MINMAIMGCGNIAKRVANGIIYSDGLLYAAASRDIEKAMAFANKYPTCKAMTYEEVLKDEKVDLIYISTINPTHYALIKACLDAHKNVICEKPMLKNRAQIDEVFALAKENHCFLMEAHKTCFTSLNTLLRDKAEEKIGRIEKIYGQYCGLADISHLHAWNVYEPDMGGCFFDIGVYPICFANLYAHSPIQSVNIRHMEKGEYPTDIDVTADIVYENGIKATVRSSWIDGSENKGILYGERGRIEIVNFWKGTKALVYSDEGEEEILVEQDSDFTGEINEAIRCIEDGQLESRIMSHKASNEISLVLETLKKQ